jgi:hypothetical protein
MLAIAIVMILAGCFQVWAGVATLRRKGELRSTQGRQLEAALGRRGAAIFFFVCAAVLIGVGALILVKARA